MFKINIKTPERRCYCYYYYYYCYYYYYYLLSFMNIYLFFLVFLLLTLSRYLFTWANYLIFEGRFKLNLMINTRKIREDCSIRSMLIAVLCYSFDPRATKSVHWSWDPNPGRTPSENSIDSPLIPTITTKW